MSGLEHLLRSLRAQGHACAALGSPMYGELLDRVAADVTAGGIFAAVLAGHENDPRDWRCHFDCSVGCTGWSLTVAHRRCAAGTRALGAAGMRSGLGRISHWLRRGMSGRCAPYSIGRPKPTR